MFCKTGIISSIQHGIPYDTDAVAFMTAVGTPDDGTVYYTSTAEEITGHELWIAVNNLIVSWKLAGYWTGTKGMYLWVGSTGSSTECKWNAKDPRDLNAAYRLIFSGGWTFGARGGKPNGTNALADTFILGTSLSLNANAVGFYSVTDSALAAGPDIIAYDGGNGIVLYTRSTINTSTLIENNLSAFTTGAVTTDSLGFFIGKRTSSTDVQILKRGVEIGNSPSNNSASQPTNTILLGGSTIGQWADRGQAFTLIYDGILTNSDVAIMDGIVDTFETALHRNV